ncbi:MAG: response regulator [Bdellovibrio sp.]
MFKPEKHILIIDDFQHMRSLLRKFLNQLGFLNITDIEDSTAAWTLLEASTSKNEGFDLIICDSLLPQMPGPQLFKNCKNHPRLKNIPFILIVPDSEKEKISEFQKTGIQHLLFKPIQVTTLKRSLEQASLPSSPRTKAA